MSEKTENKDNLTVFTPIGQLAYVKINGEETEFDGKKNGYYIALELTKKEGEELRQKALNHWLQSDACAEIKSKGSSANDPIIGIKFNDDVARVDCRHKKYGVSRKTGKQFEFVIPIRDGQGNELPIDTRVWGGSTGRLKLNMRAWAVNGRQYGVQFQMNALQVIELKQPDKTGGSSDLGFGTVNGAKDLTGVVTTGTNNEALPDDVDEDIPF